MSPKAQKLVNSDTADFTQPALTIWNENHIWQLNADIATADIKSHDILLKNNVIIAQQSPQSLDANNNLELTTQELLINQKTLLANSSSPVQLKHPQGESRADSFNADFNAEQLQLQGKVSSHYEPKKR